MIKEFLDSKKEYEINISKIEMEINTRIIPLLKSIESRFKNQLKYLQDDSHLNFKRLYERNNWVNIKTQEISKTELFLVLEQKSFHEHKIVIPLNFIEMTNEEILSELK